MYLLFCYSHYLNNFSYYHGTSTIFAYSIKESGLGAINPNIKFKNLDLLRYLYKQSELYLITDQKYLSLRLTTCAMAEQTVLYEKNDYLVGVQKLNFKHSSIYVALSINRAVTYAASNKYGSEILERCITLFLLLRQKFPDFELPNKLNLFRIDQIVTSKPAPVIIEILNISDDNLNKENGESAIEELEQLRKAKNEWSDKKWIEDTQFHNFELRSPVPPNNLKFYNLIHSGHPRDQANFKWKLIEW